MKIAVTLLTLFRFLDIDKLLMKEKKKRDDWRVYHSAFFSL